MLEGRVSVNGTHVRELGTKADLDKDDVRVDGVRVKAPHVLVYLVLNKPRGIVSTRKDPEGRPTVVSSCLRWPVCSPWAGSTSPPRASSS